MKLPFLVDQAVLDLLAQDVPAFDLTTHWLGIGSQKGCLTYTTRHAGVVSGLFAVRRLAELQGAVVADGPQDGSRIEPGQELLSLTAPAEVLHVVWKTGLNILEYASGVATRTRALVDAVRQVNPSCGVYSTRKMVPGSRTWAVQAVLHGGGMPHRLGLSETVLVFDQHKAFFSDLDQVAARIQATKGQVGEKKILVEVSSLEEARIFAKAGVDGLQFDKIPSPELARWIATLKAEGYQGISIATGGVKEENAAEYARTGVDGIATSWVYQGPGLDMGARVESLAGGFS